MTAPWRIARMSGSVSGMDRIVKSRASAGLAPAMVGSGLARSEAESDILFIDRSVNELQSARDHAFVGDVIAPDAPAGTMADAPEPCFRTGFRHGRAEGESAADVTRRRAGTATGAKMGLAL
jgi:hypothetical protein